MDRRPPSGGGAGAPGRRPPRRHRDHRPSPLALNSGRARGKLDGLAPRPVHIGCSGWSYPDWKQRFYPKGLPQSQWLAHYAERFDTVEINNTFYRLPTRSSAEQWVEETPPGFVFTVKASRYLTHVKRLKTTARYVNRFLDPLAPLIEAGKLGAVLWQLPPTMKRDDERLAGTLDLARGCRNAVEFRHESWFTDDVIALLSERGAALVIAERHGMPEQPRTLTADWTLVRLHRGRGRGGNYSKAELGTWRRRIAQWRRRAEVFAYFNNDQNAYAPANAERLARSFS
jgi:uncharacterized protein YecE (DUF72 family)